MKANNQQYHNLRRKGWSHNDACMSLGLDPDVAALAAESANETVWSIESARKEMLPLAFDVLKQVLECSERDADRIKAAQIIIQGEGVLPDINAEEHTERRRRWMKLMGEQNIIDVPAQPQLMEMAS